MISDDEEMKLNRLKLIYVDPDSILQLINYNDKDFEKGFKFIKFVRFNIPDSAIVREIHYSYERASFAIVIYDKSFDEIEQGKLIPIIDSECEVLECPIMKK